MAGIMPPPSDSSEPAVPTAPHRFCKGCGYSLFCLDSRICPECGRVFDPANRRTFARRPPRGWIWRWGWRLVVFVLVMVLAAGAGLGWLSWGWHCEQKTIGQLQAMNAEMRVKQIGPEWLGRAMGQRFGYLRNRVDGVGLGKQSCDEIGELDFKSLKFLDTLVLWDCKISDRMLAQVGEATSVQTLRLVNLRIDNSNLMPLIRLPRLAKLNLSYSTVDGKWLKQISAMKGLKELNLAYTTVEDEDLRYLHGLTALECLDLLHTHVTDAGLQQLSALKSLRLLAIEDTLATNKGATKLKDSIPGLTLRTPPAAVQR